MRELLRDMLICPVLAQGCHISSFRVTWRVDDHQMREDAWKGILYSRLKADQLVLSHSFCKMVVSSINGIFTHQNRKAQYQRKIVYPAVSYWVVHDPLLYDVNGIIAQFNIEFRGQGVGAKIVKSQIEHVLECSNALFTVAKDHNNTFVQGKLVNLFGMNRPDVLNEITKLYIMDKKMKTTLQDNEGEERLLTHRIVICN